MSTSTLPVEGAKEATQQRREISPAYVGRDKFGSPLCVGNVITGSNGETGVITTITGDALIYLTISSEHGIPDGEHETDMAYNVIRLRQSLPAAKSPDFYDVVGGVTQLMRLSTKFGDEVEHVFGCYTKVDGRPYPKHLLVEAIRADEVREGLRIIDEALADLQRDLMVQEVVFEPSEKQPTDKPESLEPTPPLTARAQAAITAELVSHVRTLVGIRKIFIELPQEQWPALRDNRWWSAAIFALDRARQSIGELVGSLSTTTTV